MTESLRQKVAKLAKENPELRKHLVPVLRKTAADPGVPRVASVSRYCEFYKARNGEWYMELAPREDGEQEDAITYGPFPDEDAADTYLRRHFSNPGGNDLDDSGRRPVPTRSPNGSPVVRPR
jgi:hypothetical protein